MNVLLRFLAAVSFAMSSTTTIAADARAVTLDVQGMDCASCPITVKQILSKVSGVSEVAVDLKSRSAVVKYDPDKTRPEHLAKVVSEYGYPSMVKK